MWYRCRAFILVSSLLILVLAASPVSARDPHDSAAPAVEAIELAARHLADGAAIPQIDGKVTDEAWLAVEPYSTFTQTDPIEGAPASERTEVRVLFDKTNLYIGVICFDSEPDKIIVNQSRRDADLTETDAIIMVLDTFNDSQNAFVFGTPQPKQWPWIRRISPHVSYTAYYGIDDGLVQSSQGHFHFFEIDPRQGGRFGTFVERYQDRPIANFTIFNAGGHKVVIPPGLYTWYQIAHEYLSDPSAFVSTTLRWRHGAFYDGDFDGYETTFSWRAGTRFIGSLGYTRQNVQLRYGDFHTDLVPVKVSYSFTTLASVQALVQYNNQSSLLSSNLRVALLNRSGTGLFFVYNDRRDTTDFNPYETLGRSFIVKYTRLFDF